MTRDNKRTLSWKYVKTSVTLPDFIKEEADYAAKKLDLSRSSLYAHALTFMFNNMADFRLWIIALRKPLRDALKEGRKELEKF